MKAVSVRFNELEHCLTKNSRKDKYPGYASRNILLKFIWRVAQKLDPRSNRITTTSRAVILLVFTKHDTCKSWMFEAGDWCIASSAGKKKNIFTMNFRLCIFWFQCCNFYLLIPLQDDFADGCRFRGTILISVLLVLSSPLLTPNFQGNTWKKSENANLRSKKAKNLKNAFPKGKKAKSYFSGFAIFRVQKVNFPYLVLPCENLTVFGWFLSSLFLL